MMKRLADTTVDRAKALLRDAGAGGTDAKSKADESKRGVERERICWGRV